ncbi:hypothetical protein [Methanohalobium sp.]|uniref:hypothetical protein n=1 Tax=Methanohalobium sp. TaxID=2837493 RepID=UPI0025CDA578|nr:hypothetical protein [Methanohalobium sp.]
MPKSGLIPDWTDAQLERVFSRFQGDVRKTAIEFYKYIGENFVRVAREKGDYTDRTGNLRSSIGFVVVENGEILYEDYQLADKGSDKETGRQVAQEFAQSMSGEIEGIGLIGFAGMEYAGYVEARGYDVITGSSPTVEKLMRETLQEMKNV